MWRKLICWVIKTTYWKTRCESVSRNINKQNYMLNTRALLKKLSTVIKVYINKNESDGIFETLLVSQSVRRKMKIEDREQKNVVFLTGKIIRKTCRGCLLIFGFQISLIQFLELSSRKIWVTDTRQFFFFFFTSRNKNFVLN